MFRGRRKKAKIKKHEMNNDQVFQEEKERDNGLKKKSKKIEGFLKKAGPILGAAGQAAFKMLRGGNPIEALEFAVNKVRDKQMTSSEPEEVETATALLDEYQKDKEQFYNSVVEINIEHEIFAPNKHVVADKANARQSALSSKPYMDLSIWMVKFIMRWSMPFILLLLGALVWVVHYFKDVGVIAMLSAVIGGVIQRLQSERGQAVSFPLGTSSGSKQKSMSISKEMEDDK